MYDIFLSYAREDKIKAHDVAEAFEQLGWSVWWDRDLVIGMSFEEEIEKALNHAKCVVVLWSKHSVTSEWVRDEAGEGRRRAILVPASLTEVVPPLSFRGLHTADLSSWMGRPDEAVFQDLCRAVETKTGPRTPRAYEAEASRPPQPPAPWFSGSRRWLPIAGLGVVALAVVALVLALGGGGGGGGGTVTEVEVTVPARAVWTDSGIDVDAGAALEFVAKGEVSGDVGAANPVGKLSGPQGIAGTASNPTYKNVLFAENHASVIGRIGDGQPFAIGSGTTTTAGRAGRLYVGVNDDEPCNNGGSFRVTVRANGDEVTAGTPPSPITVPSCV